MHTFKDRAGNVWPVVINLFTVEWVKAVHKVDLPGLFGQNARPLGELLTDDVTLCAVLYDLGQPDNKEAGRTPEDLQRAWSGETADAAVEAFCEELIDFFRDPERRKLLRNLIAKFKEVDRLILEGGGKELVGVDPEKVREQILLRVRGSATGPADSAGSTPGSSDSTPGRSRSAS